MREFRSANPTEQFGFNDRLAEGEEFLDTRFIHLYQVAYYHETIMKRPKNPILAQRYVNWDDCAKQKDPILTQALKMIQKLYLRNIMEFR